jgi:hypothetical protein
MISDIIHASGRTEKFARFGVLYDKISNFLSKLIPGDRFKSASIADGLTSEELLYLALLPPSLEQEMTTGMKPKQGIFGAESMEARVAEELGISDGRGGPGPGERGGVAGKGKKRKGGFFGMFAGEDEVPLDTSPQFIPWWSWGKLNRPGGMKLKRAFYAGVIITFVIIIILLIDRLLLK